MSQEDQQQIVPPVVIGKNRFVTWNPATSAFDEFSIKIAERVEGKNYVKLLVRPGVNRPGFLAFEKKHYQLSLHDVLRGHFNANKPYARPATTTSTTGLVASVEQSTNTDRNTNQQESSNSPRTDVDKAADLLFKKQAEQLYYSEDF